MTFKSPIYSAWSLVAESLFTRQSPVMLEPEWWIENCHTAWWMSSTSSMRWLCMTSLCCWSRDRSYVDVLNWRNCKAALFFSAAVHTLDDDDEWKMTLLGEIDAVYLLMRKRIDLNFPILHSLLLWHTDLTHISLKSFLVCFNSHFSLFGIFCEWFERFEHSTLGSYLLHLSALLVVRSFE